MGEAEVGCVGAKKQGQPLHYIRGFLLAPISSNLLNTAEMFFLPALWKIIDNEIKWRWACVTGGIVEDVTVPGLMGDNHRTQ